MAYTIDRIIAISREYNLRWTVGDVLAPGLHQCLDILDKRARSCFGMIHLDTTGGQRWNTHAGGYVPKNTVGKRVDTHERLVTNEKAWRNEAKPSIGGKKPAFFWLGSAADGEALPGILPETS